MSSHPAGHPAVTPVTYVVIFGALLLLTLATFLLSGVELGAWEVPVAMGIAVVKATLVVLFFMHLLHSPRLTWLVVACAVLFLGIMLSFTLADYRTRGWLPEKGAKGAETAPP